MTPVRSLSRRVAALTIGMLAAVTALAQTSQPQAFPSRPMHLVVPFGAGTTTDQVARFIGQRITEITSQPVIVDNRPGANGFIGVEYALSQPPDGYTLFVGTNTTHAANVSLFKKLPYDPIADFVPITNGIIGGVVLTVSPNLPVKNVQELIALAKKSPGKLTFGSGNSSSRAGGEVMRELAGIDIVNVPYKALPVAITDLMSGQIDMVFGDAPAVMPSVRSGKIRALGVSTKNRIAGYEDLPTIAEQGVPGYEVTGWIAVFAPKGTPPEIADTLNKLIVPIMKTPEAAKFFGQNAWTPIPGSREELAAFQRAEVERWRRLVKSAGIEQE